VLSKAVELAEFAWETADKLPVAKVHSVVADVCGQLLTVAEKFPLAGPCAALVNAIFSLAQVCVRCDWATRCCGCLSLRGCCGGGGGRGDAHHVSYVSRCGLVFVWLW
jgi:hypothetical protein